MIEDPSADQAVDLRDYFIVLRRQRWLLAGVVVAALLLAGAYTFSRTPIYAAQAAVLVRPITAEPFSGDAGDTLRLETEREVILSTEVAARAREQIGSGENLETFLEHVSVEIPTDSDILRVTYEDPDPRRAQVGAQAFAESYLDFRREQALDASINLSLTIDEQIADLEAQIGEANAQLAATRPRSARWRNARARRDVLTGQVALLRAQLATLATLEIDPGQIIDRPRPPRSPSSPNHLLNMGLGLFLGVFLGVVGAFVRDRFDDRIRGRVELMQAAGADVLAVIPKARRRAARYRSGLATLDERGGAEAEAYRRLRTAVLQLARREELRSLLVVSPTEKEGKSTTVANLGVALAQAGKDVVVVSADLRRPRLHEFFGVPNAGGLAAVLRGKLRPEKALVATGVDRLSIVPSGAVTSDLLEGLDLDWPQRLLDGLTTTAHIVLLDSPPILAVADALALAPYVSGVVLVADAGRSTRATVTQTRDQLEQVGARLVGAVLTGYQPPRTTYYYYQYEPPQEDRSALSEAKRAPPSPSLDPKATSIRVPELQGTAVGRRTTGEVVAMESRPHATRAGGSRARTAAETPQRHGGQVDNRKATVLAISFTGRIRRVSAAANADQAAGRAGQPLAHVLRATLDDTLLFFSSGGKIYPVRVADVPESPPESPGAPPTRLHGVTLSTDEKLVGLILAGAEDADEELILATRGGLVKRTTTREYASARPGSRAIALQPEDQLVSVKRIGGDDDVIMATRGGVALRFASADMRRTTGRPKDGVIGMRLSPDDEIISVAPVNGQQDMITVTERGFGKRTPVGDYPRKGRGTRGVLAHRLSDRTGPLVGAFVSSREQDVLLLSSSGTLTRVSGSSIPRMGRLSQGRRLVELDEPKRIAAAIPAATEVDDGEQEASISVPVGGIDRVPVSPPPEAESPVGED